MEENKFRVLRQKIDGELNRELVEDTNDVISLKTLHDCIKSGMDKYNEVFIDGTNDIIKKINTESFLNRLFKGEVPMIKTFSPVVEQDGSFHIDILFTDRDNKYKGLGSIDDKCNIKIEFLKPEYSVDRTTYMLKRHSVEFIEILNKLIEFADEYPYTRCEWNSNFDEMSQTYSDGFLVAHFNLEKPDSYGFSFSSMEDANTASIKSKEYGELYDLVDFYGESILKRLPVNINDLNNLYKKIVIKELNLNKAPVLTKIK